MKRIRDNPFYVLGLRPGCGRAEVETEGQKLLGMLELGLSAAKQYATPLGPCDRTPEKVREAMAELRDPDRRIVHEMWAQLEPMSHAQSGAGAPVPGWPEALSALGWRRR